MQIPEKKYKKGIHIDASMIVNGTSRIRTGEIIGTVYLFDEYDGKFQWRYQINDDIPFTFVPEDQVILSSGEEDDSV